MITRLLLGLLASALVASSATADDVDICADRPTKSNNTCTAPTGHLQLESDVFNVTLQHSSGVTTDTFLSFNPTLKYGVTADFDIEASIAPLEVLRTHAVGQPVETLVGLGDLYLRAKLSVNANGMLSYAAAPYIKLPTARDQIGNGAAEGGFVNIVTLKVNDKVSVTTQPELDVLHDTVGSGYHLNTAQLLDISYNLPKDVTLYGEVWGDWNYEPTGVVRQYSVDFAASVILHHDLQLDGGINVGLNHATPGVEVYSGISKRF